MKSFRLAFVFFTRKTLNMSITPVSTFAELNLNACIFKALTACGYTVPTPIQARAIPIILNGQDIVACAPTGTGKTAAFVLPALNLIEATKAKCAKPRVLVLTPTRELATQITVAAAKYGKFMRVNIASLVGGMPYRQQLRELSRPMDMIVATPGRLLDHMDNGRLDLSAVEMFVLDEADRMLDMGFIDDVKHIASKMPKERQTLLFSATVDDRLGSIIRQFLKEPIRIDLSTQKLTAPLIEQKMYLVDNLAHKNRLLQHFLANENIFKAIIFSATKIHADQLAKQLRDQGFEAAPLHGDLKQSVRNKTIENLRRGKLQYLVATDVAARGIDINDVTHVINYDLPKFSEDYVHRIGRTGRAGKTGIAISFALPLDARHLQKIEKYISQRFELSVVPGLEPTKRMSNGSGAAGSKKKKYGNKSGGGRSDRGEFKPRSFSSDKDNSSFRGKKPFSSDAPRKSYARDDNGTERKSYGRDNNRPAGKSFSRDERPARQSYARDDKPAARSFSRDERPARQSYARDDRPAGKSFSRDERPARQSYARDDRPAARSFSRDNKPAGRSFSRDDKPAGRRFSRDDKSAGRSFSRDDKPVARKSYSRDERTAKKPNARFAKKPGQQDSKFAEGRAKTFVKKARTGNRNKDASTF
jgi:superfamily II DNA/RNA helicase